MANQRKLRQHFVQLGEDGTRQWLSAAHPALKELQRKVAAAETVLRQYKRARSRREARNG